MAPKANAGRRPRSFRFAKNSRAKGLSLRAGAAWVDQKEGDNGGGDVFDFRITFNYAFDVP